MVHVRAAAAEGTGVILREMRLRKKTQKLAGSGKFLVNLNAEAEMQRS